MDNNEKRVVEIHLEDIIPNPFQPRLSFNEDRINDLAESIKLHGIIQPLVLRKNGEKYEIIAGERRFKAATLAGLVTVPAIITEMNNDESAEVALVENLQRKNLTPIEEAKSYEKLQDRGYSQDKIAKQMGVSQSSIANKLRLLNLDEQVQQALLGEKISERHARSLLNVDKSKQVELLQRVINERLTVRQLDAEIAKMTNAPVSSGLLTPIESKEENNISSTESLTNIDSLFDNVEEKVNNLDSSTNNNVESLEIFELPSAPTTESLSTPDISEIDNNSSTMFDETSDITESLPETDIKPIDDYNISPDEIINPAVKSDNLTFPEPIFTKEEVKPDPILEQSTIIISKDDFSTVIRSFDKLKQDIETAGLQISMETFNFEEYYQLIIKVFKN